MLIFVLNFVRVSFHPVLQRFTSTFVLDCTIFNKLARSRFFTPIITLT